MQLTPYVWPESFEQPIVLYYGAMRLHFDSDTLDGLGQVVFEWRRRPRLQYRFASCESLPLGVVPWEDRPTRIEPLARLGAVPRLSQGAKPIDAGSLLAQPSFSMNGDVPNQEFGDSSHPVHRLIYHVINFVDFPLPESIDSDTHHYLGRLTLASDNWRVVIERPNDDEAPFKDLRRLGGYSFTHLAEIRRSDGGTFSPNDAREVEDALFHLLGFARGTMVGLALPAGYSEDNDPVWIGWRTTLVDGWTNAINWCDWPHFQELSPLFANWLQRTQDSFWREVLKRAVRRCLDANVPNPVDSAIVVSHSALELLAWAVLVVEHRWLDPKDGELTAAGRIRLLLRWAHVETAIDPRLSALQVLASRESCVDGPAALAFVRNRIVHPPRKLPNGSPSWPTPAEQIDTWRLATEYADLAILRILGHQGHYGSRFHTTGRWAGDIERVPWVNQDVG